MTHSALKDRLGATGNAITSLFEGISAAEALWKPAVDRWSLLEIVNHLGDEERLDFRTRLEYIIRDPSLDWPPFNSFAGVEDGTYATRDFADSVARFREERATSIEWLESLDGIDDAVQYTGRGSDKIPLRAGDLMSSWVAHDYFHLRQIIRLRWDYLASDQSPFDPGYAGVE